MQTLQHALSAVLQSAIADCYRDVTIDGAAMISKARQPEFGDFQSNVAMTLAKKTNTSPRDCAQRLVDKIKQHPLLASVEIANPGFINLRVDAGALAAYCNNALADTRLGVPKARIPQTVVVDYSSANVAKEMHVGHLRSTVIGDAIARLLQFLGHRVIRQNHLGDWGTQFGMIIEWMLTHQWEQTDTHSISELNTLYRQAKAQFDADEAFATRARERVVKLQAGDSQTRALWQRLVDESLRHFQSVYERLGVLLSRDDVRGESAYNEDCADAIGALEAAGVLVSSQGAKVVFLPEFIDRDNKPVPMIVQKSDGGYLYATTDIAALRYRLSEYKAQRIIYVTDARQKQHFAMLFELFAQCGWLPEAVRLDHVAFGTILGPDRKPYKTREGEVIHLSLLLDEAEAKALNIVNEKQASLTPEAKQSIAEAISIGAIKYADLSTDKIKDVIFNWDHMLAFEGNTAPYLQNAYVRVEALFRKADAAKLSWQNAPITLASQHEHQLALLLVSFPDVIAKVADDLALHRFCHYLYDVASQFHRFYEHCPVLSVTEPLTQQSRLQLCALTANTLKQGLSLLGIAVLKQM